MPNSFAIALAVDIFIGLIHGGRTKAIVSMTVNGIFFM